MKMRCRFICALLIGGADTENKAKQIAHRFQVCPYVDFMATKGVQLLAVLLFPERKRWWAEYIGKHPNETFGLQNAEVTFMEEVHYPRRMRSRLPDRKQDISPCKSNCGTCQFYGECDGCPATIFYRQ